MTHTELTIPPPPTPAKARANMSPVMDLRQSDQGRDTMEKSFWITLAAPQSNEPSANITMLVYRTL